MDASDIIAIFSALISAGLTLYVIKFTKNQNKKSTILHMHQIWTSEFYRRARLNSYNEIHRNTDKKIKYSHLAGSEAEFYLGSIEHFFGDLHHLIESGDVDKAMARRMFAPTVKAYFSQVFDKIDYDIEAEEGYFRKDVLPLRNMLDNP